MPTCDRLVLRGQLLLLVLAGLSGPAVAADSDPESAPPTATTPATPLPRVDVEGKPWLYNRQTRYAHSMPEVDGTEITVTKKASVEKLDDQPTVIDNNQRALLARLPGLVIAEQQNPTQLNLSYRGLGNPQESEYTLSLQDGIPIVSDWIGFPTLYYLPVPQSLQAVQMIRGGSGLLYGPEPQPVINYISRAPDTTHKLSGYAEQVGGSDGLFSSFNTVSGAAGDWDYRANFHHRQSDGQRVNGDYQLEAGDLHVGYHFNPRQKLSFDFHGYSVDSGDAGRMSYTQYLKNRYTTTTPYNHVWVNRYTGVLTFEDQYSPDGLLVQKLWTGYQDLSKRSASNFIPPQPAPSSTTLDDQRFTYTGFDTRLRQRWARGNALTAGVTAYVSHSPWQQYSSPDLSAARDDRSGTPVYDNNRRTRYGAVFAENVFRFGRFHIVPSVRYEYEELRIAETLIPARLTRAPIETTYTRAVPLYGIGFGNDFGRGNETYVNIAQGYRPLRYLDVASPFGNFDPSNQPQPTKYLSYEAGVHGWPYAGFYYDVSLFQVRARDRIESQQLSNLETVDVNTGNTRHRGAELELDYDVLRLAPAIAGRDHLTLFVNASLLDARFTGSLNPAQVGKVPAYAPHYLVKAGATLKRDDVYTLSLTAQTVGSQYWQDSNAALGTPGAANYIPAELAQVTVVDLSADYRLMPHLRLLGGVSNLGDRRYYNRVFQSGLEPASGRTVYGGASYEF